MSRSLLRAAFLLALVGAPSASCGGSNVPPPAPVAVVPPADAGPAPASVTKTGSDGDAGSDGPRTDRNCDGACRGKPGKALSPAVQATAAQARHCYNAALQSDPTLEGGVSIRVRVVSDGTTCAPRLESSQMPDEMNRCILDLFAGARFPAPSGDCVDVMVPFSFLPIRNDAGP